MIGKQLEVVEEEKDVEVVVHNIVCCTQLFKDAQAWSRNGVRDI